MKIVIHYHSAINDQLSLKRRVNKRDIDWNKSQLTFGIGCRASFLFVLNVGMLCRKQDMLIPCFFVDSMSHKPNSLNAIWMTGQIPEFEIHNPCIFDNAKIRSKHANLEIYMDHLIYLISVISCYCYSTLHFQPFFGIVAICGRRQWAWKAPSHTSQSRYLSSWLDWRQFKHHLHFWHCQPARITEVIRTWAPV